MEMLGTVKTAAGVLAGAGTAAVDGGKLGAAIGGLKDAGASFGQVLTGAEAKAKAASDKRAAETRKAAEGLVSHALILPMLKQLRHSTFNQKGLFAAGDGEKAFGPEFDMEMADRIARSPKMTLTTALANRLQARRPVKMTSPATTKGVDVRG